MEVNGKFYSLWGDFVNKKAQFIGGTLQDAGDSFDRSAGIVDAAGGPVITKITDIVLRPNGEDSAYFEIEGESFSCGFDVKYGGIMAGQTGWVTFSGYGGQTFRIKVKS